MNEKRMDGGEIRSQHSFVGGVSGANLMADVMAAKAYHEKQNAKAEKEAAARQYTECASPCPAPKDGGLCALAWKLRSVVFSLEGIDGEIRNVLFGDMVQPVDPDVELCGVKEVLESTLARAEMLWETMSHTNQRVR